MENHTSSLLRFPPIIGVLNTNKYINVVNSACGKVGLRPHVMFFTEG